MSSEYGVSTKTYLGSQGESSVLGFAIDDESAITALPDNYTWDQQFFDIESGLQEDDSEAVFEIQKLIRTLESLRDIVEDSYVKVRLSDDHPISFLTKDDDRKVMASVAPMNADCLPAKRLNPVEANLLGYHVFCNERSDCDWVDDRFRLEDDAVEAARDHRYFTGHECRIKDYEGEEVDFSYDPTEVSDQ
jgi:hypothetical protein